MRTVRLRHTRLVRVTHWIATACFFALLVSVALPNRPFQPPEDPLEELRGLAETAGANIVGGLTQKRQQINPGTYIGKGKLEELQEAENEHRKGYESYLANLSVE